MVCLAVMKVSSPVIYFLMPDDLPKAHLIVLNDFDQVNTRGLVAQ
jgi:hypothetical protein